MKERTEKVECDVNLLLQIMW